MISTKIFTMSMPTELKQALELAAKQKQTSQARIVEAALILFLSKAGFYPVRNEGDATC